MLLTWQTIFDIIKNQSKYMTINFDIIKKQSKCMTINLNSTSWYFNMFDYFFLQLHPNFVYLFLLLSGSISSIFTMRFLTTIRNKNVVFATILFIAILLIMFLPSYFYLKTYSDSLSNSDIDRLISKGYITSDVLNQLSENINIEYDTLEKNSKKNIVIADRFLSYADLVMAMSDLKKTDRKDISSTVKSDVADKQLLEIKESRIKANALIDEIKSKINGTN